MRTADLLTLFTRAFAGCCLLVIAAVYGVRREWVPAVLFFLVSALVWLLAVGLYRKMRADRQAEQGEDNP